MMQYFKTIFTGTVSLIKGMVVTYKNLISTPVTVQYPKEKPLMQAKYRGLVDLRPEKCTVCYLCVKICPTGCLFIEHEEEVKDERKKKVLKKFNFDMEYCCFCGLCEEICPTKAIYLNDIYEVSAYDDKQLCTDLLNLEKYKQWQKPLGNKSEEQSDKH